jgi:hypothetical protein
MVDGKKFAGAWWETASIALYTYSLLDHLLFACQTQVVTSLLIVWSLIFY